MDLTNKKSIKTAGLPATSGCTEGPDRASMGCTGESKIPSSTQMPRIKVMGIGRAGCDMLHYTRYKISLHWAIVRFTGIFDKVLGYLYESNGLFQPLIRIQLIDFKCKPIIGLMTIFHESVEKPAIFTRKQFRSDEMGIEVVAHPSMASWLQSLGEKQCAQGMEHGII